MLAKYLHCSERPDNTDNCQHQARCELLHHNSGWRLEADICCVEDRDGCRELIGGRVNIGQDAGDLHVA
jgi:hypothetical protein